VKYRFCDVGGTGRVAFSTGEALLEREVGWDGISAGALAFIAAIVCGIFTAVFTDDFNLWLGLAICFLAAGNLLGGVRTPTQLPLGEDSVTTTETTPRG
jgi:hypothetical protein